MTAFLTLTYMNMQGQEKVEQIELDRTQATAYQAAVLQAQNGLVELAVSLPSEDE